MASVDTVKESALEKGGTRAPALPLFSADICLAKQVATKRVYKELQTRIVTKRGSAGVENMDAELIRERKRACQIASGATQLNEMMRLLDSFGLQRSRVQKNLHLGSRYILIPQLLSALLSRLRVQVWRAQLCNASSPKFGSDKCGVC